MHATIRRYEGVDASRTTEVASKVRNVTPVMIQA